MVFAHSLVLLVLAGAFDIVLGVPALFETRQTTSTPRALGSSAIASYTPFAYYASAAYCNPASTKTWTCGINCNNNSAFKPYASGGDGGLVQYWFVGYDTALQTAIVSYEGTDTSKIIPLLTDFDFSLNNLNQTLFPGIPDSVEVHEGFAAAHESSADPIFAAVKKVLAQTNTKTVTVVGHSLGGALATLSGLSLQLTLPSGTQVKTVTFGTPRVGNSDFASYFDAHLLATRINNKMDMVPIMPAEVMGFRHTAGEIHISSATSWMSCPGQENDDDSCTDGSVSSIFVGKSSDHNGPYNQVMMHTSGSC
ncbi:alpha/beta-hydrolase [Pluteus cervinus]|uniref:Alpha/beta-hydrolase n=1 Tax=Pluteus cervinus TaxID=181527 RepID=A0ACD3AUU3_9AGAR|nr:alpha/beta-hydrolase [Pluteus cervinus]